MSVSVVKSDYFNIHRQLRRALSLIGYEPAGEVILIKPNAASAYGHYLLGDYTSPQLIESFIKLFPDREYIIAEGSAVGMRFHDAAKVLGYDRLAEKYKNVRLVDLNQEPRVELNWKFGKIGIPRIVLESEYVNMPKMKTHNSCTVTLGLKNQKGLLDEKTKKKFHRMDIHEAIRELANTVRPELTIVDGIIGLEGNGPNSIAGRPKLMRTLVAGRDIVEVDNVCMRLMCIPENMAKHVEAKEAIVLGESVSKARKKFKLPVLYNGMLRTGNTYIGITGCSGCLESFSGGIRGIFSPEEIHLIPLRMAWLAKLVSGPSYIYIGRQKDFPASRGYHICMGNCTRGLAQEKGFIHIPGCPPEPGDFRKALDTALK